MLLPALNAARESARKASCMSNLKQIGLGIKQYANMMKWEGWYPNGATAKDAFNQLISTKKLTDTGMYICPSATSNNQKATGTTLDTGNVSYKYVPGLSESAAADSGVAKDADGNHADAGNCLFVDGHVGQFDTIGNDVWDGKANVGQETTAWK